MFGNVKVRDIREDSVVDEVYRAYTVFPVHAHDPDSNIFVLRDGDLGFMYECTPLVGADSKIEERLKSLINTDFPAGTVLSWMLVRSPNIKRQMAETLALRVKTGYRNPVTEKIIRQRLEFLDQATIEPHNKDMGQLFFDLKLYVSVVMATEGSQPNKEDFYTAKQYHHKVSSSLKTIGFGPREVNGQDYTRILGSLVNWGETASWRPNPTEYDPKRLISDQILDYDKPIDIQKDHLKIGDHYVKSLSAKRLPNAMYFGDAIAYVGDLRGGDVAVKEHYAVICNILYPDYQKHKANIERKRMYAVNQAKGPLLSLAPILAEKKQGFDEIYASINDGNRPLKMSYSMLIFAPTLERAEEASVAASTLWREQRFTMLEDKLVEFPMFINSLPLCADPRADGDIWRYKSMTAEHATVLIPTFGEWKGTGTPHVNLLSRNGQIMSFSMHDSGSNKNMIIAATSGGGKSFFANELILSYLSEGAKIWVVDVGRSYEKLAESIDGNFLQFGADSNVCTNPFPLVVSLDGGEDTRSRMLSEAEKQRLARPDAKDEGEEDALVGLISAMASQGEVLSDFQLSSLRRILREVWKEYDRNMTVDHIRDACFAEKDQRVKDLGTQLYAFSTDGSYGRFFSGQNNLDLNNQFTVLELEELKSRQHLQKVILFQLIYQIQQEVYLGERDRKKVVIIDEGWDLIQNGGPEVKMFIEHAYRRFRKYGASVLLITQSVQDMYKSEIGEALIDNSATLCLFRHKDEAVEKLKSEGKLVLPGGGFDMLKTVHTQPPHYSEVFIKGESGIGIGRLIVNPFQKLLYSTDAVEVNAIKKLKAKGMDLAEAIETILKNPGQYL